MTKRRKPKGKRAAFLVRVSTKLHAELERLARAHETYVNDEVVEALEKHVAAGKKAS